jgi:hypothetical protein
MRIFRTGQSCPSQVFYFSSLALSLSSEWFQLNIPGKISDKGNPPAADIPTAGGGATSGQWHDNRHIEYRSVLLYILEVNVFLYFLRQISSSADDSSNSTVHETSIKRFQKL